VLPLSLLVESWLLIPVLDGILEADALLLNHFEGLVRNWVKPDDGDVERGGGTADGERELGSWACPCPCWPG